MPRFKVKFVVPIEVCDRKGERVGSRSQGVCRCCSRQSKWQATQPIGSSLAVNWLTHATRVRLALRKAEV